MDRMLPSDQSLDSLARLRQELRGESSVGYAEPANRPEWNERPSSFVEGHMFSVGHFVLAAAQ
jgi:hypothetical protein